LFPAHGWNEFADPFLGGADIAADQEGGQAVIDF